MKLFPLLLICVSMSISGFSAEVSQKRDTVSTISRPEDDRIFPASATIIEMKENSRYLFKTSYNVDGFYNMYWWELQISYLLTLEDNSTLKFLVKWSSGSSWSENMPAPNSLINMQNTFYLQVADVLKIKLPENIREWNMDVGTLVNFELIRDDQSLGTYEAFGKYRKAIN